MAIGERRPLVSKTIYICLHLQQWLTITLFIIRHRIHEGHLIESKLICSPFMYAPSTPGQRNESTEKFAMQKVGHAQSRNDNNSVARPSRLSGEQFGIIQYNNDIIAEQNRNDDWPIADTATKFKVCSIHVLLRFVAILHEIYTISADVHNACVYVLFPIDHPTVSTVNFRIV